MKYLVFYCLFEWLLSLSRHLVSLIYHGPEFSTPTHLPLCLSPTSFSTLISLLFSELENPWVSLECHVYQFYTHSPKSLHYQKDSKCKPASGLHFRDTTLGGPPLSLCGVAVIKPPGSLPPCSCLRIPASHSQAVLLTVCITRPPSSL